MKARSVSEIVFTGIVPATIGLPAAAGAATPDRAPSKVSAVAGGSPANDPARHVVQWTPTHSSAPRVIVSPVSRSTPSEPTHSAPAAVDSSPSTPIAPAPSTISSALVLALPALGTPSLIGGSRQTQPNGVLWLLSSLALGMLVVASLMLLRRVGRLNGGWWAP